MSIGSYMDATLKFLRKTDIEFNTKKEVMILSESLKKKVEERYEINMFSITFSPVLDKCPCLKVAFYVNSTQGYIQLKNSPFENLNELTQNNKENIIAVWIDQLVSEYAVQSIFDRFKEIYVYFFDFENIAKKEALSSSIVQYSRQTLNEKLNGVCPVKLVNNYYSDEAKVYLVFTKKKDYEKWVGTEIIQEIKQEVYEKLKEADVYDYIREEDYEFYVNLSPQGVGQYYFELEENLKTAVKV